jgi:hypothetical protein
MLWLAAGAGLLLLLVVLAQGFAGARVETIRKAGLWSAGILAVAVLGLLLFSGRAGQMLWTLALFAPILGRRVQGWWARWRFGQRTDAAAGVSAVETATLAMRVALDTGAITGRIKRGAQAGRDLAELDLAELLALLRDCQAADPESVPLLEAWLDRAAPDWRSAGAPHPPMPGGPMSRAEALDVLGLAEGAPEAEIRAAHRRLMQGAHPDKGGSDWLAARINQARDVLLP